MPPAMQRAHTREIDVPVENLALMGPRRGDSLLLALNDACEHDDLETAAQLLIEYEGFVTRQPIIQCSARRAEFDNLISAHGRLWTLLGHALPPPPAC
jgi:nitrite reductase/ring-hydroxylating ferredoxin subunit